MKKLVSSWVSDQTLPRSYILPPGKRPGDVTPPACKIPVIDLSKAVGHDRASITEQIMHASKQFGLFQVINHGVPKELLADAMRVFVDFFELPDEDKLYLYSEESCEKCKLYTSSFNYANEDIHYWRDCLKFNCSSKECTTYWPNKPDRYREVVWEYSARVRRLGMIILDLICEGLGLTSRYFDKGLSTDTSLVVNHYPPCPDPSLTLGLPKHCDPNMITLLLQGNISGLQVFVDEQWLVVEPCPDAFVVNIGYQIQVISNGRLKSAEHRVVTNVKNARTSVGLFIAPSKDCTIFPAKTLVNANNPSLYKPFRYSEFLKSFS